MKVLCHRLQCLSSDDLEEAARCNLAFFGKLERPSLTAMVREAVDGFRGTVNKDPR